MERERRARLPWAIVLLILALSCAIAIAAARIFVNATTRTSFTTPRRLDLNSVQSVQTVGDGFVYYDGNSIVEVDSDGRIRWSYLVGSGASYDARDAGVASWVGRTLMLLDGETGIPDYSDTMPSDVVSARMGEQYAAVLLGSEDSTSSIVLMETGGTQIDTISLTGQDVVDYGFFADDTLFWMMVLDTDGTVPTCTINVYRPGRRLVGSISDSEQIFYHVLFESAQLVTVGETHLKIYEYNGTEYEDRRRLLYGWTLADADDNSDDPMMAFVPNGEYDTGALMQDIRMIRGDRERTVRAPYGCEWLIAAGDCVYGFTREGYVMEARLDRQQVNAYPLNLALDAVYGVTDDGVAVLGSGGEVYLARLGG